MKKKDVLLLWSIFLLIFFVLVVFTAERTYDSDTLWHIRAGEEMLKTNELVTRDTFSWTAPGVKWTVHSWLYEVIVALLYHRIGFDGLWILTALLAAIYAVILLYITREKPVSWLLISAYVLSVFQMIWCIRPHTLMLVLFAFLILLFEERLVSKNDIYAYSILCGLFCVWSNIHSSVVAGLLMAAIYALYGKINKILLVPAFLGTLLNPQGPGIFYYSWKASSDPSIINYISEWLSPDFHSFFHMLIMFSLLVVIFSIKPKWKAVELHFFFGRIKVFLPPFTYTLIAAGLYLYLKSMRHIAVLTILLAAAIKEADFISSPVRIERLRCSKITPDTIRRAIAAGFLIATLALIMGGITGEFDYSFLNLDEKLAKDPENQAAIFLKETGRTAYVFNEYHLGNFLIWHGIKVFIDPRADMYVFNKPEVWWDYLNCYYLRAEKPEDIFQKYGVRHIVLAKDAALRKYIEKTLDVKKVYENEKVVIYDIKNTGGVGID